MNELETLDKKLASADRRYRAALAPYTKAMRGRTRSERFAPLNADEQALLDLVILREKERSAASSAREVVFWEQWQCYDCGQGADACDCDPI
jgi:hypothetical protein